MQVTQGQTSMIKEDELFDEVGNIVEEFKEKSKDLRLETKKSIKQITREYKEQLRIALSTLDREPSDHANLIKPTEIFETLTDKQNSVKREESEKQSELENEFKTEVLNVINCHYKSNNTPIRIIIPTNWSSSSYVPIIEYHSTTGEPTYFRWGSSLNNLSSTLTSFNPKTHRLQSNITKSTNTMIPFKIISHNNGSIVPLGSDIKKDKLWKEMIDYLRPFQLNK